MNNVLIITESRTVAKAIAQALEVNVPHKGYFGKNGISVTWTGGGIIASRPKSKFQFTVSSDMTADETFAANFNFFIRSGGKGKGVRRPDAKDEAQMSVIEHLWRSSDKVYNAMKPSAPGEVIFACVDNYIGALRPVGRLWLNSITRREIVDAFAGGGNAPEGYAGFHDNAIAEHTIGARPTEPDYSETEPSGGLWNMADLKAAALRLWGWSPAKTAGVAYALYNKGLVSYPADKAVTLPASLMEHAGGILSGLRYHPVLGKKAVCAAITGTEGCWSEETAAHHAVMLTGLYPVDLSREEDMLYTVTASQILDFFTPGVSGK